MASAIAEFISSKGCNVILLVRNPDDVPQVIKKSCVIIKIDPAEQFQKSLEGLQIDVVIYAAGAPASISKHNPEQALSLAVNFLVNLVKFFSNQKVLFIYLSTIHVYGKLKGIITENTLPNCRHPYGLGHLVSERLTEYFLGHERFVVLRLANIFGMSPVMNKNARSLFLNEALFSCVYKRLIDIRSDPSTQRIFIPMTSFNNLILSLIDEESSLTFANRIFNFGYGQSLSLYETSNMIKDIFLDITGETVRIICQKDRSIHTRFVMKSGLDDFITLSRTDIEYELQKSIRQIL